MSRYGIDKVLRHVMMSEPATWDDVRSTWSTWLEDRPHITNEEKRALVAFDVGALYAMGAHPFLLWVAFCRISQEDAVARYRHYQEAIAAHGYPDFGT